jgi:lipoate-protein ligase A
MCRTCSLDHPDVQNLTEAETGAMIGEILLQSTVDDSGTATLSGIVWPETLQTIPATESAKVRRLLMQSLVNAPLDLEPAAWASRIRAAIPCGVDLLEPSIPELARRLCLAIDRQTGTRWSRTPGARVGRFTPAEIEQRTLTWKHDRWHIVPETPLDPWRNLALDEHLAAEVARGHRPPTLRFWGWSQAAVVLGRSQLLGEEVAEQVAQAHGLTVTRRLSGGGAMLVTPTGSITYSLYLPEATLAGYSLRDSYELCDAWAVEALRELGIDAHYVPVNDIGCPAGKIAGAAQARRAHVVLHHTTMAYEIDQELMIRVLRLGQPRRHNRGVVSAAKTVAPLASQTSLSREHIVHHLQNHFLRKYDGKLTPLTADDHQAAEQLLRDKYLDPSWLQGQGL